MAAIDLRSTTLWIVDGTVGTNSGAINHSAGYAKGIKTVVVNGFSIAPKVGEYITIGTHIQYYVVLAATTTSITFFPGLVETAANTDIVAVLGNGIYAKIGEGNLTYDEKRNLVYIRDRGFIDTVKLGDEEPMDVSMDFTWEFLRGTSTTPPTFEEAFKQIGRALTWASTSSDSCEPYCVDIVILDIPPCGSDAEKIILPEFRWESISHDLKGAKISVKGTCNVLMANVSHGSP